MKHRVGDIVRVKSLEWYNKNKNSDGNILEYNSVSFTREMKKYCGQYLSVSSIDVYENYSVYSVHETRCEFADYMLEDYIDFTKLFENGDTVYTDLTGEGTLEIGTSDLNYPLRVGVFLSFTSSGYYCSDGLGHPMIYPNKEKDWSYIIERYNKKQLLSIKELTLQDIADKFDIPVEYLRIKE